MGSWQRINRPEYIKCRNCKKKVPFLKSRAKNTLCGECADEKIKIMTEVIKETHAEFHS